MACIMVTVLGLLSCTAWVTTPLKRHGSLSTQGSRRLEVIAALLLLIFVSGSQKAVRRGVPHWSSLSLLVAVTPPPPPPQIWKGASPCTPNHHAAPDQAFPTRFDFLVLDPTSISPTRLTDLPPIRISPRWQLLSFYFVDYRHRPTMEYPRSTTNRAKPPAIDFYGFGLFCRLQVSAPRQRYLV
ncbi:hypothetical protein CRG98_012592 [Punica granatum]|uniref:Secreted protein n=1 Tax=Punica granatum TaxID=22663 RepID=A0A2I0KEX4_PUNGR|nr:hypothetical protein CRG98_012592 [Punica granatum]